MDISRYPVRAFLCAALLLSLTGCPTPEEKKAAEDKRFGGVMENPQESPQFQAFIGKLRKAVANRDYDMIVKMTTPNFGYDLSSNSEGPLLAIQYWNQNGLWPELERVLSMPFIKKGQFLVGPPQFAMQTTKKPYSGFRAGVIDTSNGYRLAYFVGDSAGGAVSSDAASPAPVGPDPNTYIGDTPPSDSLPLPQSTPPMPNGPRVLANPTELEYNATPMPRIPRQAGPLTPAP